MKYFFSFIFFACIITAKGQTIPAVKIDFDGKKIEAPGARELRNADYIQLKIANLPSTRYKVTVNKTDSVIVINQPPALFGTLSFGEGYNSLLANLTDFGVKVVGNIVKNNSTDTTSVISDLGGAAFKNIDMQPLSFFLPAEKAKNNDNEVNLRTEVKKLMTIDKTVATAKQAKKLQDYIFSNQSVFNFYIKNSSALIAMQSYYSNNVNLVGELTRLQDRAVLVVDSLKADKLVKVIFNATQAMRQKLFDFHFTFRKTVIEPADQLVLDYKLENITKCSDFNTKASSILTAKTDLIKQLEDDYRSYFNDVLPSYDLITKTISLSKSDSMIQNYRKDFYKIADKIDTTFGTALIAAVCNALNTKQTEFISLPYSISGDITKFHIQIDPLDTRDLQSFSTDILIPGRQHGFFNFSSGIYGSTIGKSSEAYSFQANIQQSTGTTPPKYDTLNYSLKKESGNKYELGIVALLHAGSYFKQSDLAWQFAFGPGLSLESKPRPRIMIGGGLAYGRKNKILLSAGWMGGPVKVLSDAYSVSQPYPSPASDILKDKIKGGFVVTLTYAIL